MLTRATPEDMIVVVELLTQRAEWLARRGIAQWSAKDPTRDTAATISAGETWLLRDESGRTIGTITLSTRADPDFWSRAERCQPALYPSKIATRIDCAGQGLGELLLHAGFMYARQRGLSMLRWDVWRTNRALQAYYRSLGAHLLRVVDVPRRFSGALFEWKAMDRTVWQAGSPSRVTIDVPLRRIGAIESAREDVPIRLGVDGWDPLQPTGQDHLHRTTGLWVEATGQPVVVMPNEVAPSILFHSGDHWRIGHKVVSGPDLFTK
jgi:ribosomal protein S18 acetylase RimI-like enzyme